MTGLFLIVNKDKPDGVELRAATRPAHLEFVGSFGKRVKLAGPILRESDGAPCGSMVVMEGESVEEIEALVRQDPYYSAGVYASIEVRPWIAVAGEWAPG